MVNEVERIFLELVSIKDLIGKDGSPSDAVAFEAIAAKCLLLAVASYFEKAICELIIDHAMITSSAITVVSFLDNQALCRKYHTLFDWKKTNINKFISYFGNEFSSFMENKLSEDTVRASIKEFMYIGHRRNELVHENFSVYPLAITCEDIKGKFDVALPLVVFLRESLREFEQLKQQKQEVVPYG